MSGLMQDWGDAVETADATVLFYDDPNGRAIASHATAELLLDIMVGVWKPQKQGD